MEDVKIKISALWVAAMLVGFVASMLELFEPSMLEQIIAGEVEGMKITHELLLLMGILMVIPPIMVFLTLILKDSVNRWANVILGIFFAGFGLTELLTNLGKYAAYYIFVSIVGFVLEALIVWYAWKWRQKA